jgi:MYXO-CTERM domain-containing protein
MLVELEKGSAPTMDPLKFEHDSVYRNMDYDVSSELQRTAEINIAGLKALPGTTHRDVYLYVKTVNMPAPTGKEMFLPKEAMQRAARIAKNPPRRPMAPPATPDAEKNPAVAVKPSAVRTAAVTAAAAKAIAATQAAAPPLDPDLAKDSYEHMVDSWPTYEVHVYHDTGKYVIVHGKKYKLLEPQVPFGYFVDHDGPFFGFEHSIEGVEGAKLEKIGPDFYRLTIANDRSAKVKTRIAALEEPPKQEPPCCPKPPPVKVEIKPRCYCSTPGASGGRSLVGWALALGVGLLAAARQRRRGAA